MNTRNGNTACRVTESWVDRIVVVAIAGDLDIASSPEVADVIRTAIEHGPTGLILDLSRVEFLASAGISLLISAHRDLSPSRRFGVVADGPATSRPLRVIGVDTVLAVYRTLDEALCDFA